MEKSSSDGSKNKFSWKAAAVISILIVGFLLLVRPFGLSVSNGEEMAVVVGFAPVNFAALLLLHAVPLPRGALRAVIAAFILIILNFLYLAAFVGAAAPLLAQVALIGGIIVAAVASWRRQENLAHEIFKLRKTQNAADDNIVLRGENESETLRIPRSALRFAKAEGNYARIVWRRREALADQLLRATLKDLELSGEGALVRCHRSFLVNLRAAERVEGNSKGLTVHFADGATVPVSRNYVQAIKSAAVSN